MKLFARIKDNKRRVIKKGEQIYLGQPSNYPSGLVTELKNVFQNWGEVRVAYLAQVYIPTSGDDPHVVIGIDINEQWDSQDVISKARLVASPLLAKSEFVDFIVIDGGVISDYMTRETRPFFIRLPNKRD